MVAGIKHTSRYSKQEVEDALEESRKVLENAKANPTVITENDEMNFLLSVLTGYAITSAIFSIVDYARNLWNSKNVTPIVPKDAGSLQPEPPKVSIEAQEVTQAVDPILKAPNDSSSRTLPPNIGNHSQQPKSSPKEAYKRPGIKSDSSIVSRDSMNIGHYNQKGSYMGPGIKPDPYIQCMNACDQVEADVRILCQMGCLALAR